MGINTVIMKNNRKILIIIAVFVIVIFVGLFISIHQNKDEAIMPKTKKFFSEYSYSIMLPANWAEYELDEDEKNTNGFFNTGEWSGNLRITPFDFEINSEQFINNELAKHNAERISWNNISGIFYGENAESEGDLYMHYWYLITQNRLYLCSFAVDPKDKDTENNGKEFETVIKILKSLKNE
jgi:hypothetical protein